MELTALSCTTEFEQKVVPLDQVKFVQPNERFTVVALLQRAFSHPKRLESCFTSSAELWDATAMVRVSLWYGMEAALPWNSRLFDVFLARNCVMVKGSLNVRGPIGSFLILNSCDEDYGGWSLTDKERTLVNQMRALSVSCGKIPGHIPFVAQSFVPALEDVATPPPMPLFHSLAHVVNRPSGSSVSTEDEPLIVRVALVWEDFGRVQILCWYFVLCFHRSLFHSCDD